jgi:hypothetical protein
MKELDYLWLFFVIAAGVATGNLISNWITARIAAYEMEQLAAAVQESVTRQTEQLQAQTEEQHQRARETRASSPMGRTLERACKDWRQAQQQTPTFTTQTEAQKHCNRYEQFLATGSSGK